MKHVLQYLLDILATLFGVAVGIGLFCGLFRIFQWYMEVL